MQGIKLKKRKVLLKKGEMARGETYFSSMMPGGAVIDVLSQELAYNNIVINNLYLLNTRSI